MSIRDRIWAAGLLCLFLLAGCTSQVENEKSVVLEQPQAKNGVILADDDPAQLEKLAEALDAIDLSTPGADPAAAPAADAADQEGDSPARISAAEAVGMSVIKAMPPDATSLVTLPKLSDTEVNEVVEHLMLSLESEFGYAAASATVADALPVAPTGVVSGRTIARTAADGTHVLRFGYRPFVSQPPQFWTLGVVVGDDETLQVNPDLAKIGPKVTEIIASLQAMRTGLTVRDLEAKLIQLSYVDAATALSMLKGFGITTMGQPTEVPPQADFAKLPYVVHIADPKKEYTGLVGAKEAASGGKLSMAPGGASELADSAITSPMSQLLVLFHPAHPEQFSEVRRILDTFVDRPARQIFIEAMVLEISEQGLRDLGIEWELNETPLTITAGSLMANASPDSLRMNVPDTSELGNILRGDIAWDWDLTIRALLRTGKAEILSRPSVLTLNNRQSTIRVGRDIPIASSLEGMGSYGSSKVSFKFDYLPTGILLNIRPRIAESGKEVSMLIDTIVSAKVPGADLVMRSADDVILAAAPTISTRRVQTYGRIPNNTPLIIGGLVAREETLTQDKIPILGDLPWIGMAFRSEIKERMKREVIIVLTPHVLPEKDQRQSLPKDEDLFDSFGNDLFRDSYRIRSEDVFDLTFLLENQRIVTYRALARQVAEKNFRLGATEPFRSFVRDSVPGESILVTRMIYEVVKRLEAAEKVDQSRIIYFKSNAVGGYDVNFLEQLLKDEKSGQMKDFGKQALAITFHYDRASLEEGRLGSEPIPEISLVDCPDRDAWGTKLWELNQPMADGQEQHTILLQDASDVLRLRRALVLKRVAVLNGSLENMRLKNFSVGKVLLMPELKKGQIHVVDADTARFFFHTEHYYAATLAEIETQLKELDRMLKQPEISILLDSDASINDMTGGGQ